MTDSTDIEGLVERLRALADHFLRTDWPNRAYSLNAAADVIASLTAKLGEMEAEAQAWRTSYEREQLVSAALLEVCRSAEAKLAAAIGEGMGENCVALSGTNQMNPRSSTEARHITMLPLPEIVRVVRHCLIAFAPANASGQLQVQIDNARAAIERAVVSLAKDVEETTPAVPATESKRSSPKSSGGWPSEEEIAGTERRLDDLSASELLALADRLDKHDHMISVRSCTDDEMVNEPVSADEHNAIVFALRLLAAALPPPQSAVRGDGSTDTDKQTTVPCATDAAAQGRPRE